MISHVYTVEERLDGLYVWHHRHFLINGRGSLVKTFEPTSFSEMAEYLKEAAEKVADCRVYIVARENAHFAYELPPMESEEDILAAVKMRLKKDLLFPVGQFFFASTFDRKDKRTAVQVCGAKASSVGELRKALSSSGVDIHRVYMRDDLIYAALKTFFKDRGDCGVFLKDSGLLYLSNDLSKQVMHRFSLRQGGQSESGETSIDRKLVKTAVRTLNRQGWPDDLYVEKDLVEVFNDVGSCKVISLDTIKDAGLFDPYRLAENPSLAPSSLPWFEMTSEEGLGFTPTKIHGLALVIVLWFVYTLGSLYSTRQALGAEEAGLEATSAKIARAVAQKKNSEKELSNLKYIKEAFSLFDGETYSTLSLIEAISASRGKSVKVSSLKPSEDIVQISCSAANEKDAFTFVSELTKHEIVESASLKGMSFSKNRRVNFVVELIRNG